MDETHHVALLTWMLLSIPASGLSFFLTYPEPISMFHLFYAIMNLCAVIIVLIGWFDDLTEASTDWDEPSPSQTLNWSLIGLVVVLVVSLVLGFVLSAGSIQRTSQIAFFWVPHELYPLQIEQVGVVLALMMGIFGTWFSVVAGEEGMKINTSILHKAYEHTGWELPFALHPARLLANGIWAVMHVLKGQYPFFFGVTVFASGLAMDSASARSGSILTNYFVHAFFNSLILIANFLLAGALTIKVI